MSRFYKQIAAAIADLPDDAYVNGFTLWDEMHQGYTLRLLFGEYRVQFVVDAYHIAEDKRRDFAKQMVQRAADMLKREVLGE